jgi:CubicO group peptidase (beta-lactamase class C family)
MDIGLLSQAIETVKQDSISLYSLLVIRNGYIVSETYSQGATGQPRKIFSCTKSFTSTLVGITFDQGLIDGVNPSVLSFFPGSTFQNNDARKQSMTLENVLIMNTGLDWVEGDPSYQKLYITQDWAGRCTTCPWQPNRASFSTIANAAAFACKYLFGPLGIQGYIWDTDNQDIPIGGWGLKLTPREIAKLGYLFLHNGQWEGRQVVSSGLGADSHPEAYRHRWHSGLRLPGVDLPEIRRLRRPGALWVNHLRHPRDKPAHRYHYPKRG